MNIRATATSSDVGAAAVYRISTEEVAHYDDDETVMETTQLQDVRGDARIRWVYFMLGAATLLAWNGMSSG
jgi:hypothetical protein